MNLLGGDTDYSDHSEYPATEDWVRKLHNVPITNCCVVLRHLVPKDGSGTRKILHDNGLLTKLCAVRSQLHFTDMHPEKKKKIFTELISKWNLIIQKKTLKSEWKTSRGLPVSFE